MEEIKLIKKGICEMKKEHQQDNGDVNSYKEFIDVINELFEMKVI